MLYDLHLHSSLSPCADNDMTPTTIMGMLSLAGVKVAAITDHNSARNLPAASLAAAFYNIKLLFGIEVNTSEEIHVLCYFTNMKAATNMSDIIYDSLPDISVDTSIWGEQLVVNEDDEIIGKVEKLLSLASGYDIYEIKKMAEDFGGIAVPAHIDREANSLLSIMGFMPPDLDIEIVEMADPTKYEDYVKKELLPPNLHILRSSDAHNIERLVNHTPASLDTNSRIMKLIYQL